MDEFDSATITFYRLLETIIYPSHYKSCVREKSTNHTKSEINDQNLKYINKNFSQAVWWCTIISFLIGKINVQKL